mgnify:CR=1 FL=1
MKKIKILSTVFLTFGFAPASFASDWPVWGGNGSRNMISQEKEVVMDFNPGEMDDNEKDEYDLSCSRCQMTRADFKKQARLGCPECYKSFSAELTSIAQAMHHSKQHIGKIPFREGKQVRLTTKISCLQNKIDQAIKKEETSMF